jgi:molybdate transport system substrate-binding protein
VRASFFLFALVALAGCEGVGREEDGEAEERSASLAADPLLVLAASDLQAAFHELVPRFEANTGRRVDLVLGSTGNLAAQIRHGAPADLFFAANETFLDGLIRDGRIQAESRQEYAVGRLALVAGPGADPPRGMEALTDPDYPVVAMANPEHAPYGMVAREALAAAGIWDEVEPRLILGENISHTLQFVQTGNADAGMVALALVRGVPGATLPYTVVSDTLHSPLRQVAGVVDGTTQGEVARQFLDYVLSPEGQAILDRFGFEPPGGERGERAVDTGAEDEVEPKGG